MKLPVGSIRSFLYDCDFDVDVGDVLQTTTGRFYIIIEARKSKNVVGRWNLKTVVIDVIPENTHVFSLEWYR